MPFVVKRLTLKWHLSEIWTEFSFDTFCPIPFALNQAAAKALVSIMKKQIQYWLGWAYQIIFGLGIGFIIGLIIAVKPKGGGGLLRSSDTLPFVLGMGMFFATVATQFYRKMDKGMDEYGRKPQKSEEVHYLSASNISNVFSIFIGIMGVGLMEISFLKTFKILAR